MKSSVGMGGSLGTRLLRPKTHTARGVRIPGLGRVMFTRDPGDATIFSREVFASNLTAFHRDGDGCLVHAHDLGSGLVTAAGVLALANDWNLAAPSGAAINTLKLANWHATGTGATAAAISDIALQTVSTAGGQTPVAGTQSIPAITTLLSGTNPKYQTVATISYTGTEAVTEWGLHTGSTLSASTGSPFTAGTASTGTVTATPLTASSATVQGQQQTIFHNTGNATPSWGLVTSNTTSVVTVPAWLKVSDASAGVAPANTNAYVIRPVMWDHKVFAAINVISGDSIQFTYQLTVQDGG